MALNVLVNIINNDVLNAGQIVKKSFRQFRVGVA